MDVNLALTSKVFNSLRYTHIHIQFRENNIFKVLSLEVTRVKQSFFPNFSFSYSFCFTQCASVSL